MTQPRLHIDDYVTEKTRDFTGREWVFQEMDMWLAKEDGERFFLLTGEPGIGKSAIAARLTQIRPVAAHHFCIAGRNSTVIPGTMLRSLAAQLGDTLPGFAEALAQTIQSTVQVTIKVGTMTGGQLTGAVIENLTVGSPERDLDLLLRAPLSVVSAPKEPVLVMIDSLDEAVTVKDEVNIITLLTGLGDLPAWVRFFCTTRPDRSRVLRYFDGLQPHVLAAESQMNLGEC